MKILTKIGLWVTVFILVPFLLGGLVIKFYPRGISESVLSQDIYGLGLSAIGFVSNVLVSLAISGLIWEKLFAKKAEESPK